MLKINSEKMYHILLFFSMCMYSLTVVQRTMLKCTVGCIFSMKWLGMFPPPPPPWMDASYLCGYSQHESCWYPIVPLHGESTVKIKCLASPQEPRPLNCCTHLTMTAMTLKYASPKRGSIFVGCTFYKLQYFVHSKL